MRSHPARRAPKALDRQTLEQLALAYVSRYATTRARLTTYLKRKLDERGWDGTDAPQLDGLVERLAGLGYVDDAAFASARAASLSRRGFGARRITQALAAAGIRAEDRQTAREEVRDGALEAALRFARRKRIGPFARGESDRKAREKAIAAMARAGHPFEIIRQVIDAAPDEFPETDTLQK